MRPTRDDRTDCLQWMRRRGWVAYRCLVALCVLGAAVSVGPGGVTPSRLSAASGDDWPTLAHDAQRTGAGDAIADGPYAVQWGWNTTQSVQTLRIGGDVQPVVAGGRVFLGTLDGTFVALDAASGAEDWRARTDDAIMGTAAVAGDTVFVGSQDAHLYAFDVATGAIRWTYTAKAGIWAAPLIVEGVVAIGARDGTFVALDVTTGAVRWSFRTDAPITMSAAYSARQHLLFVGAENAKAFALDSTSGTQRWAQQLPGQGFRAGWPVVAENADIVVFRTMPAYYFGDLWAGSEGHLIDEQRGKSLPEEQAAIRDYLTQHPDHQTFHALHMTTGAPAFVAPMFYVGAVNLPPAPPVLNSDGTLLVEYVTRQNFRVRAGESWDARWSADFGRMDLTTGAIAPILLTNVEHGKIGGVWPFRLITDEGGLITRAGTRLLQSDFEAAGGVDTTNGSTVHFGIEYHNNATPAYPPGGIVVYGSPPLYSRFPPDDDHFYLSAGVNNSPIISAGGVAYWRVSGGAVVAVGHQA